jgi:hypothetical protein
MLGAMEPKIYAIINLMHVIKHVHPTVRCPRRLKETLNEVDMPDLDRAALLNLPGFHRRSGSLSQRPPSSTRRAGIVSPATPAKLVATTPRVAPA